MIEKEITITDALISLRPNSAFAVFDNNYETIEWFSEESIPTKEEVNKELKRLESLKNDNKYKEKRAMEYPSIQDQFDILYHEGYDGWKEKIQEVKDRYPKP